MVAADAEGNALDVERAGIELAATIASTGSGAEELAVLPKLQGSYRIIRLIGEGGAGAVYEAEQLNPRRRVAIKALRPGLSSPRAVGRLRAEAEILGMLHHPGIAQVFEAGISEEDVPGQAFIVMELVQGLPITKFANDRQSTLPERVRLIIQVCRAIEHAHQRGVIHRDLKPANILIDEGGRPRVLDFGVARVLHDDAPNARDLTEEGAVIGTLSYMSPEQAAGLASAADVRADVYALGAILYELASGRPPIDTRHRPIAEAFLLIQSQIPPSLGSVDPALRGDLSIIVARALEKEPDRRFPSVSALADDLERYLQARPIQSRAQSIAYVLARQIRRHRIIAALSLVLMLTVVTFSVWSSVSATRFRRLAHRESDARRVEEIARRSAERERAERERINARLEDELAAARLERGRLEARSGNGAGGESILFPPFLNDPASLPALGAIRELIETAPRLWSRMLPGSAVIIIGNPKHNQFVVGNMDGSVRLLDARTGRMIGEILPPESPSVVRSLGLDPNGQVWVAHESGLLRRFVAKDADWKLTASLASRPNLAAASMSDDGRFIATAHSGGWISLWSANDAAPVCEWRASIPAKPGLAFSPDGSTLAASSEDGSITFWNVADGSWVRSLPGHSRGTRSVVYTDNGASLVSIGLDHRANRWNLETGESTTLLRSSGQLQRITVEPDGDLLIINDNECWALSPARLERSLIGYSTDGFLDGARVGDVTATIEFDGEIRAWHIQPTVCAHEVEAHATWVFGLAIGKSGTLLVSTAGDGIVRFSDASGHVERSRFTLPSHRARCVIFGPRDENALVGCSDGKIRVFDSTTFGQMGELEGPGGEVYSLAFSEAAGLIAAGSSAGKIRLWNSASLEIVGDITGFRSVPRGLAFSPDGATIYSSGSPTGVLVCNVATRTVEREFPTSSEPWSIALSPDGYTIVSGLFDASVCMIDLKSGEVTPSSARHRLVVAGLDFAPDGKTFASGGDDGTVRIWATEGLREITRLDTTLGPIPVVTFDEEGDRLLAGAATGTIKVWDLRQLDGAIARNLDVAIARYGSGLAPDKLEALRNWQAEAIRRSSYSTDRSPSP